MPAAFFTVALDVNETIGQLAMSNGSATLAIGSNQLTVTNAGVHAGTVMVTAGTITIAGGTLSTTGGISLSGGASLNGTGTLAGTIAGAGTYQASGGTLHIESAVLASATGLQIANDGAAILELDSTVASGAAITFAGAAGTLDLTDISGNLLQGFSGTIAGLNVGNSATVPTNQIDLAGLATANITAASLDTTTDVVKVTTTGGSFTLQLSGSYLAGTLVDWITDSALTGSDLFLSSAACYCRGTLILTDRGEVAVEELAIGDQVVTEAGWLRPIKWIGRRSYVGWLAAGNPKVLTICFKPGSLADRVPRRELWVSPEHAMYLDGVLVPAELLVNGSSIVKAAAVDEVDYFHLELDSHDLILAEGAWAESFVDDDSRGMFHNAAEYGALYLEAPFARAGAILRAASRRGV